jgi:hypothetical protein
MAHCTTNFSSSLKGPYPSKPLLTTLKISPSCFFFLFSTNCHFKKISYPHPHQLDNKLHNDRDTCLFCSQHVQYQLAFNEPFTNIYCTNEWVDNVKLWVQFKLSFIAYGNVKWHSHSHKPPPPAPTPLDHTLPYDPEIPHLAICWKELKRYAHTKACTWVFSAGLFIISPNWKQPRCPLLQDAYL